MAPKPRGIYERPAKSGIWWILYYADGVRHREKVGLKSDAIDLYRIRKADIRRGQKLPDLSRRKAVTLSDLIDDAIEYAQLHNADISTYTGKGEIVRAALGTRSAADLTPQDISRWLTSRCKTNATSNRYRAFISLCYREGIANRKVAQNPARLVRMKSENNGRLRFLTREEIEAVEQAILKTVTSTATVDLAAFQVSVHTGMRLSEQFRLRWREVQLDGRAIDLTKTKNGSPRLIPLNTVAYAAIERIWKALPQRPKANDFVFPQYAACRKPDVRPWFPDALKAAGITEYTWHGNRHTFCSWLAMAGVSLKVIQELAGHKTISMTARYAHLSPDHKRVEIERIAHAPSKLHEVPKEKSRTATATATGTDHSRTEITQTTPKP